MASSSRLDRNPCAGSGANIQSAVNEDMTRFGVPASAAGYLYQLRYALLLLLRAVRDIGPTIELSIERTDDIALEEAGETTTIIQTKHHQSAAPLRTVSLTDASVDLWKTFRIWSEGVYDGSIRVQQTLLHLISTASASQGSAAAMLRPADRDVPTALGRLRAIAATSRSNENAASYAAFSRLSESQQQAMLGQVRILDASTHVADLRGLVEREMVATIDEGHMSAFLERLEGWWVNRVIEHLTAEAEDRITGLELARFTQDLVRQFRDSALPIDELLLDAAAPTTEDHGHRMFVRQLRLIALGHSGVLAAIQDYYRAYTQRSRWTRDDLLYMHELERYERRLIDEWRHAFALMEASCPTDESGRAAAGLSLYSALSQRPLPIRPDVTDGFIVRGSLHMLADELRIGWHADFMERLRELVESIEDL